MPIRVLEIHNPAVRIEDGEARLGTHLDFYQSVLGLSADSGRPALPGIPGYRINVGETGQIHLIGGYQPSRLAKTPDRDPAEPHIALAVANIAKAKAELDQRGVPYWY